MYDGPYSGYLHVYLSEYFLVDRCYSERILKGGLSSLNAPRCGMLAAETKTAAGSHQQPTTINTWLAECSAFNACMIQIETINSKHKSGQFTCISCVPCPPHPIRTTRCISCFDSACVLLFHLELAKTVPLS